jgi:hypothetical protein
MPTNNNVRHIKRPPPLAGVVQRLLHYSLFFFSSVRDYEKVCNAPISHRALAPGPARILWYPGPGASAQRLIGRPVYRKFNSAKAVEPQGQAQWRERFFWAYRQHADSTAFPTWHK